MCDAYYVTIIHNDDGSPLNLGRGARLFSPTQRVMIAGLQGGCTVATCDAPPSFCEIHHITPWIEGGKTDVLDGIMLCRHHHMQLHNFGHRIKRIDAEPGAPGAAVRRYEDSYFWVPAPTPGQLDPPPVQLRFRGVAHNNACAPGLAAADRLSSTRPVSAPRKSARPSFVPVRSTVLPST